MKVLFRLVLIVMLVLFSVGVLAGPWHPGIIHAHSTFSDGYDCPPAVLKSFAKMYGAKFLIVTDHFEQIPESKKLTGKFTDDFGFDKYINDFSSKEPILCIPGAEITCGPHVLVIENIKPVVDTALASTQKEVMPQLAALKTVAAHPNLYKDRIFQFSEEGLPSGIEFFNENEKAYQQTLASYLKLISEGKDIFVTSGCDSHLIADPTSPWRWSKKTWIWAKDGLDENTLKAAFSDGRTYAACNGAWFKELNFVPGFREQNVESVKFAFVVSFSKEISQKKLVKIYRDGQLVAGSVQELKPGQSEYSYSWEDTEVAEGEQHTYVIELTKCLLTSPIKLMLEKAIPRSTGGYDDWAPQTIGIQAINSGIDFITGQGRAIAFLSNRSGQPAIYFADTETKKSKFIADMSGFVEQFNISPSDDKILLVDQKREVYLLLLKPPLSYPDQEGGESQFPKKIKLGLTVKLGVFPSWESNDSFHFTSTSGEIKRAQFSFEEVDLVKEIAPKIKNILEKFGVHTERTEVKVKVENPDPQRSFLTGQKDNAGHWQICILNSSGQVTQWLTKGNFDSAEPEVGQIGMIVPLGMQGPIVYTVAKGGNQDIGVFMMSDKEDIQPKRLTTHSADDSQPCWAFYTKKIYFTSNRSGQRRIWEMENDGSNQKIIELP